VGSGLSSGGRPHAILRSRQKVQARLGRRGSLILLDDRVLPVLLAFGGGVAVGVGIEDGTVVLVWTGMDAAEMEGYVEFDEYVDEFNGGGRNTGNGIESGNFRPIAVNGGPSSPRANGFVFVSTDGVLVLIIASLLRFGTEKSWEILGGS
jgi:hypothetical protein